MDELSKDHHQDQGHNGRSPAHEDPIQHSGPDQIQHALTFGAMNWFDITVDDFWPFYLSMGGTIDKYEVDAYLHGLMILPAAERDTISQSFNEMIDDAARGPRAPYSAGRTNADTGTNTINDTGGYLADGAEAGRRELAKVGDVFDHPDSPAATVGEVFSVVYSSSATQPLTNADLTDLLATSRRNNHSAGLTGLLLYRGQRFLQVLEGPEAIVRHRMGIIRADSRHDRVRILVEETRGQRQFPVWTMRHGTIGPAMTKYVSGYERMFADAENDADPVRTIQVLRDLLRWFQDRPNRSR